MSPKRPPKDVNPPLDLSFPPSLSQYSISEIAALVDEQVQNLSKPSRDTLMFDVFVVNLDVKINKDLIESTLPVLVDISLHFKGERYPTKRLYFSSIEYPPPIDTIEMKGRARNNTCPE